MNRTVTASLMVAMLTLGCGGVAVAQAPKAPAGVTTPIPTPPSPVSAKAISDLEARLKKAEDTIRSLSTDKFSMGFRLNVLEGKQPATITADASGYSILRTAFGTMLLKYTKATPYLDGYEITIGIANLTEANFSGVDLGIDYGPPLVTDEKGNSTSAQYQAYFQGQKHKDISLLSGLLKGSWSYLKFTIAPARAEDIRELSITPVFSKLSLPDGPMP